MCVSVCEGVREREREKQRIWSKWIRQCACVCVCVGACVSRRSLWISDLLSVFSILAASVEISKCLLSKKGRKGWFFSYPAINNQISAFSFISVLIALVVF